MASNQSTQYNSIASSYASLYPSHGTSSLQCAAFEEAQIHAALTSPKIDITGRRVLDLACGNAFYATRYLAWGAASVTGVDISEGMVEFARSSAASQGIPESKLRFVVGDVTDANLKVEVGPFDIVTSSWLLNYAPDTATMTKMWDTIASNLWPGGVFVGLTIPPLLTARWGKELLELEAKIVNSALWPGGVWDKYGMRGRVLELVEEGLKIEIELGSRESGDEIAVFDQYYLRSGTYQRSIEACIDAKLGKQAFEGIEWQDLVLPETLKEGRPVGFWNDSMLFPECRVCIAKRVIFGGSIAYDRLITGLCVGPCKQGSIYS